MKDLVRRTAKYAAGIVAINTVSSRIRKLESDVAYFPKDQERKIDRETAGVSGYAIRELAQEVVRNLSSFREDEG